jgi:hypothetical protein
MNARVRTEGLTRNGKVYVTRVDPDGDATAEITIQGTFEGSSNGGAVWNVAGIAVSVPEGTSAPAAGAKLHLRRPSENDKAGFSQVEPQQPEETGVDFGGKLTAVDVNARTISVVRAGTQIRVNITGTILRADNKRPLTLSQLQSMVGRDITVRGLTRKANVLYAAELVADAGDK